MAYSLQHRFETPKTTPDDLSPTHTPPSEGETPLSRDNVLDGVSKLPQEICSEGTRPTNALGIFQLFDRASDTDLQGVARTQDMGYAATQPINVPMSSAADGMERPPDKSGEAEYRYHDSSSLEEFMSKRRPSISFHPQVTLDTGHHRPLQEPLPKLSINTKPRGRPTTQERPLHPVRSPPPRSHSESACREYDKGTGKLLDQESQEPSQSVSVDSPGERLRWPLLQSTVDSLARENQHAALEQGASLTSNSTVSTAASEPRTPPEGMDLLISPLSACSPFPSFPYPTSLENSSAWPKSHPLPSASRAASYTFERYSGIRQGVCSGSRRSTSSSKSPATAFLSRFAREQQEALSDPDSEGQEVGEYVIGKQVGFGGFSTVKEAYTLEGDERICRAVKIVRKQVSGKSELENEQFQADFEHEVSLWRCLGHRNILPLIEVYVTKYATFCFTKLNTGGTLFDLVRANRHGLSRDLGRRYAYQLASAIRYLHEDVRVVHRDIKLENCLIDISDPDIAKDGGNLLLCDFGLAEFVTSRTRPSSPDPYKDAVDRRPLRNIGPSETSTSIAGSLQYASPELIMSPAGFLSSVADMWAYGVVIYALLVGKLPFQHAFQPRVQMLILAGQWDLDALEKAAGCAGYEDEVVEFVSRCLDMQSEDRWTIGQVLRSRWLHGCQEMLEELRESWKL